MASASQSGRYEVENGVDELRENRAHFLLGQVRPDQSDSAVYVVAHSAGADQAFVVISGSHAAYRKAVPFVSIWHGDCVLANPVQVRDIYALLDCTIGSHLGEKVFVGVDSRRDFHSRLEIS